MRRFKKKPVRIEAEQFTADNGAVLAFWCGGRFETLASDPTSDAQSILIPKLEGTMKATIGDWIIKGVAGEFYPCKPAIFDATYEEVIGG
jgi:hypothetical protein